MVDDRDLLIYVAGPLGSESNWDRNVAAAIAAANDLLDAHPRIRVHVPHLSVHLHAERGRGYEDWMAMDFAVIRESRAVFRVAGTSPGADREVALARDLGLPVFRFVDDAAAWAEMPGPGRG